MEEDAQIEYDYYDSTDEQTGMEISEENSLVDADTDVTHDLPRPDY